MVGTGGPRVARVERAGGKAERVALVRGGSSIGIGDGVLTGEN
jgi:hypothetical protein